MAAQAQAAGSGQAARTATERLLMQHWQGSTHSTALATSVLFLADAMDRELKGRAVEAYVAVMMELTPEECVRAFSRALAEQRFFPAPAVLRSLSSRAEASDLDREDAMLQLRRMLMAIRIHTVRWLTIGGEVISDRDAEGRAECDMGKWERKPFRNPPKLPPAVHGAVVAMGLGDFMAGIAMLGTHPSLRVSGDGELAFAVRDAEKLEARWCDEYGKAKRVTR